MADRVELPKGVVLVADLIDALKKFEPYDAVMITSTHGMSTVDPVFLTKMDLIGTKATAVVIDIGPDYDITRL